MYNHVRTFEGAPLPEALLRSLRRIRRRLLLVRALEAGLLGAIAAAPVAAAVTVLRIARPESVPLAAAHPALPLALVACGLVLGFLVRLAMGVSLRQAAIAADHAAGLQERLATALEVLAKYGDATRISPEIREASPGFPPPSSDAPGLLDGPLLAQAAGAAASLDPSRLHLARTAGRSAKALLAAVLVLVAAALVPPMGGPPVPRPTAERAAEALRRWEARAAEAAGPDIRDQVRRTIAALGEAGLRQSTADEATRAAVAAAVRAAQSRKATLDELQKAGSPELEAMARAAAAADASGASAAAETAASRLAPPAGSPPAPEADRRRVADGLSGAAGVARGERFAELAEQLQAAADALRRADAEAARRALRELAGQMTQDLGQRPGAGAEDLIAAVGEARRAMGLAEIPAGETDLGAMAPGAPGLPGHASGVDHAHANVGPPQGGQAAGMPPSWEGGAPAAEGRGAAAPPVPAEVRPEDRDVVRRYFGG